MKEREFLHKLSTPVSTLGLLIHQLSETEDANSELVRDLQTAFKQLHKLLTERRNELK